MRIIPRSEWGARHGDGRYLAALPAREVWLHHSVTIAPDLVAPFDDDDAAIRAIEDIGADRFGSVYGFPYTWGITPVGRIYEGHAVNKTGAHTQGHNTVGRAIVLVGNYERDAPTDAQIHAIAWLLNHAHARGWIATPQLTGGHRDTKATACPGRHAYARIPDINRLAAGGAATSPTQEDDDMLRYDQKGPAVTQWQHLVNRALALSGTAFDGGGVSYRHGTLLKPDGHFGPKTLDGSWKAVGACERIVTGGKSVYSPDLKAVGVTAVTQGVVVAAIHELVAAHAAGAAAHHHDKRYAPISHPHSGQVKVQ